MAVCQAKMPSCVYAGEGCIANIKDILHKEKAKSVLVFTDRGLEKSGLLRLLTDELDAAVQKNIIPLIKTSQHEAIVRSIKDIIRNDSTIMDSTRIGYCAGYEKQSILEGDVFCLSSLLASVIYYACVEVS